MDSTFVPCTVPTFLFCHDTVNLFLFRYFLLRRPTSMTGRTCRVRCSASTRSASSCTGTGAHPRYRTSTAGLSSQRTRYPSCRSVEQCSGFVGSVSYSEDPFRIRRIRSGGFVGSVCFAASRLRIRNLPSTSKKRSDFFLTFLSLKNDVNLPTYSNIQNI
jgi:hypothetical protein